MTQRLYLTKEEIQSKAKSLIGTQFKEWDVNGRLSVGKNKGKLGHIIEEGAYGYSVNPDRAPDFKEAGVELKVTPYKWVSRGKHVSAKERLVLTMVNYMEDYKHDFYSSHCLSKLWNIQFLFYEHELDRSAKEYTISAEYFYEFDNIQEEDRNVIINDYNIINKRIRDGEAHLISESDTFYLSACTKSSDSTIRTEQPFIDILAKPRAFSLKTGYMTELLRNHVFNEVDSRESLLDSIGNRQMTINEAIDYSLQSYRGKTLEEIDTVIERPVNRGAKSYLRNYVREMMKIHSKNPEDLDEFKKAGIIVKTIRVQKNGKIKEDMSFPTFQFTDIIKEDWENSTLRNYFTNHKFLFVVFDEIDDSLKRYQYRGHVLWSMNDSLLDNEAKRVWDETVRVINDGLVITEVGNITRNNLPKTKFSKIMHVRPHGKDKNDTYALPDGRFLTKQCFWLDKRFILKIILDNL